MVLIRDNNAKEIKIKGYLFCLKANGLLVQILRKEEKEFIHLFDRKDTIACL